MLVTVAQRLVRKVCPYCAKPYSPPKEALKFWGLDKAQGANFMKGSGCFNCMDMGYKGRTGLYEVLLIDEFVQEMILKQDSAQAITRAARESGRLTTLRDDAARKVLAGVTTLDEAASAVMA
jgi:type IV pilus assembly protein PilB